MPFREVIPLGITTLVRLEHLLKALRFISVTLLGIVMLSRLVHFSNA